MIAKGNLHGNGAKLVSYILQAGQGERVVFGGAEGFAFFNDDLTEAARLMQRMADVTTNCEKPWFHTQTRLAPGEHLTGEQWEEVRLREEKRLGFEGLPCAWSFHVDKATGEQHMHAAWFRVDVEKERAIDPGLFKRRLIEVARRCELDFALRELNNYRRPHDIARTAGRDEVEESRRLATDVRTIRAQILGAFQQSDSGKAFKAALDALGMVLANGDRRDCFVVIDAAGGHHALNKKLTNLTLKETRARLADLDPAQLPNVDRAKEMQAERQAALAQVPVREAARAGVQEEPTNLAMRSLGKTAGEIRLAWQLTQTADQFAERISASGLSLVFITPEEARASERTQAFAKAVHRQSRMLREGFAVVGRRGTVTRIDQRVTGAQWEDIQKRLGGIERAQLPNLAEARAAMREANRAEWLAKKEAERAEQRRMAPLGKVAAEIRAAWTGSRDGEGLSEALAARGMTLARVSAEEAYASERNAAFARQVGNRARRYETDEIVVVSGRGNVYALDERTTGALRPGIDQRLATVDRNALLNVADSQEAMRAASWESWRSERQAERERIRPASQIETRIADCAAQTFVAGAHVLQDQEGRRLAGADALAERLQPEEMRESIGTKLFGPEAFAARLEDAGIAIVRATAADELALAALRRDSELSGTIAYAEGVSGRNAVRVADLLPGDLAAVTRNGDVHRLNPAKLGRTAELLAADLPSIVEARARFAIDRERTEKLWGETHAEIAAARDASADRRERRAAVANDFHTTRATSNAYEAAAAGSMRKAGRVMRVVEKVFEVGFNMLFGWAMSAPKLTTQQVRDRAQAEGNLETLHARDVAAGIAAREAEHDWRQHVQKTTQQEEDLSLSARFGTPATREANIGRERDDDYGRERER